MKTILRKVAKQTKYRLFNGKDCVSVISIWLDLSKRRMSPESMNLRQFGPSQTHDRFRHYRYQSAVVAVGKKREPTCTHVCVLQRGSEPLVEAMHNRRRNRQSRRADTKLLTKLTDDLDF